MPHDEKPELVAFLLADNAGFGADGKYIVAGIFDRIASTNYPAIHPSMTAYIRLRVPGGRDQVDIELIFVSPGKTKQFMPGIPFPVKPDRTCEGVVHLRGIPFHEPGTYQFQLAVDGSVLGSYSIELETLGAGDGTVN